MSKFSVVFGFGWFLLSGAGLGSATGLGVRAQSLGEAYRAVATSSDILFYNPAGLIRYRRIGSDLDYLFATESRLNSLSISLVDSKTTSWGMGLAYNAGITAKSDIPTTHLVHLALAMPIITDQFAFGANFSYFYDPCVDNDPYRHFFNIDLGLFAYLGSGFSFAVVGDHLLANKGLEKSLGISVASALALGDILETVPLTASFDWSMTNVKSDDDLGHTIGSGLQYVAIAVLPIRVGYKSALKPHGQFLSLGTGIMMSGFSLDGLYQQNLTIGKIRQFGLALRIEI